MHSVKMATTSLIALLCVFGQFVGQVVSSGLARGFNERIQWLNLEEGLDAGKRENKPVFLLFHKSWCGACKALKPKFEASQEIEDLSHNFAMVNIADEEDPEDKKYSPDGAYIPRVLILDSKGVLMDDIYNENGSADYKYYYPYPNEIASSMKRALEKVKNNKVGLDEL